MMMMMTMMMMMMNKGERDDDVNHNHHHHHHDNHDDDSNHNIHLVSGASPHWPSSFCNPATKVASVTCIIIFTNIHTLHMTIMTMMTMMTITLPPKWQESPDGVGVINYLSQRLNCQLQNSRFSSLSKENVPNKYLSHQLVVGDKGGPSHENSLKGRNIKVFNSLFWKNTEHQYAIDALA